MDCPMPIVSDDGGLSWSDSHSMDSDDGHSLVLPNSPPPWADAVSIGSASASISSTASHMRHTGQLSPISTGMDIPGGGVMVDGSGCHSSASTNPHLSTLSTSSSSCTSWSTIGYLDPDDVSVGNGDNEMHWEQSPDDMLTAPKLEPMDDDDFRLDDVKEAPLTPVASSSAPTPAQPKTKRPRGRPRKHPLTPVVASSKITKGRSKTGCITCRKRKKKCDEAKPRCMNCEKNAVVCEGYPEKQIWKSGRERAEEDRLMKMQSLPVITMQPIFNGLETPEDMIFWKHYNDHLSAVLTVEGEHKNAFKDILIPIATRHQGLMHSILALSSKHLDYETPYGVNFLKKHPGINVESLQRRADFHHEKAMEKLYEDIARQDNKDDPDSKVILSARYGQMICLLLESLTDGNPRGEHRVHLQAYQTLIQHSPPEDPAFLVFIMEFFQYHIFADELIRFPDMHTPRLAVEDWAPMVPIVPPRLLGVADGLFNYLCQITSIRNRIRMNITNQIDPVVDYTSLYRAAEIDAAIRDWAPEWPPGDSRDRVTLVYKQMMWVYLFRTIYPPSLSSSIHSTTSQSTVLTTVRSAPSAPEPASSLTNTPPRSVSASCASSPSPKLEAVTEHDYSTSRRHSIANPKSAMATAETHNDRASPPPIRRPPDHDSRITVAVDESLAILDSFKPSDPVQALLLIPCVVIGAASFAPSQQERIRAAVRTIRGYTGLRNTDRVIELLEEIWRHMDRGDWARVWDWQGVAHDLGMDFLCA